MESHLRKHERQRLLITGGNGMLGSAISRNALMSQKFEVKSLGRDELDVRDPIALSKFSDWGYGGWIIHCAATVDVEGCARDPETARSIIVEGTNNIASFAILNKCKVLYPQSFLIYDGSNTTIKEHQSPNPISLYGGLKWEAERILTQRLPDSLIVRMAGFFGGESKDKNFVGRIIPAIYQAIIDGKTTFDIGNRVWQPTWTEDLAINCLALIQRQASGIYHMGSVGEASFYEITQEIVSAMGWSNRIRIVPVETAVVSQNELGRRPDRAVLACDRLYADRIYLQRDWRSTLHAYLSDRYFDQFKKEQ